MQKTLGTSSLEGQNSCFFFLVRAMERFLGALQDTLRGLRARPRVGSSTMGSSTRPWCRKAKQHDSGVGTCGQGMVQHLARWVQP